MSPVTVAFLALLSAVLSSGASTAVVTKRMSRTVDDATAEKIRAEAKGEAQRTATAEVDTLRQIIQEVRASEATKVQQLLELDRRVRLLEERERHQLTRSAVAEGWTQAAYLTLLQYVPNYPPPPHYETLDELEDRESRKPTQ